MVSGCRARNFFELSMMYSPYNSADLLAYSPAIIMQFCCFKQLSPDPNKNKLGNEPVLEQELEPELQLNCAVQSVCSLRKKDSVRWRGEGVWGSASGLAECA